jgi:hypothetical protein
MYNLCNSESIMVTQKIDQKKPSFWTEIFMTCGPLPNPNLPILVLSNKTEYMQSRQTRCDRAVSSHHNASRVTH